MAHLDRILVLLTFLRDGFSQRSHETSWRHWKAKFGKKYTDSSEELRHYTAFANNIAYIEDINAKNSGYTLGINPFTDLTTLQFAAQRLVTQNFALSGRVNGARTESNLEDYNAPSSRTALPSTVDWVSRGAVTPVIDQGSCGSCWAISTVGALEAAFKIQTGTLLSFSVQQFLDCDFGPFDLDSGCSGGNIDSALNFAKKHALCTEATYRYEASDGICRARNCTIGLALGGVRGFREVARIPEIWPATEEAMMSALSQQPVAAWIDASSPLFQHYQSGVLSGNCGGGKNHAVLVVGYGTNMTGGPYWNIKNSFGERWGMSGYALLQRHKAGSRTGECGVLQWPTYPVIAIPPAKAMNIVV